MRISTLSVPRAWCGHRKVLPSIEYRQSEYLNNRAENRPHGQTA